MIPFPELKAPAIDRISIVSETVFVKLKSGPKSRDKLVLSSLNWLKIGFELDATNRCQRFYLDKELGHRETKLNKFSPIFLKFFILFDSIQSESDV